MSDFELQLVFTITILIIGFVLYAIASVIANKIIDSIEVED